MDLSIPLVEQDLVPIAPWQTLENLEQRRVQSLGRFKEEYMAMLVDDSGNLYDIPFIRENLVDEKGERENELFCDVQGRYLS